MTITSVFVTLLIGGFAAIGLAALAYLMMIVINSVRLPRTEPEQDVMDTEFVESPTVQLIRESPTVKIVRESPTVKILRRPTNE